MKKAKPAHHENHERWLVSYADFITLLFAFFVVMFATAQQDKGKAKEVAESVKEALEHGQLSSVITGILNRKVTPPNGKGDSRQKPPPPAHAGAKPMDAKETPPPKPVSHADLAKPADQLAKALDEEMKSGKITIELNARGLVISLREAAFFASGDDVINAASMPIIEKIAAVIRGIPNPLRLEGHTDSIPIHNSRFRSNWELSAARSIAMLELLRQRYAYPVERMSVAGYAENAPSDTNDTEEGRAHNRRVELVVLSAEALGSEPPATPASPVGSAAAPSVVPGAPPLAHTTAVSTAAPLKTAPAQSAAGK